MPVKDPCKVFTCSFKMAFLFFMLNTFLSIPIDTFPKWYTSVKHCVTLCLAHGIALYQCVNTHDFLQHMYEENMGKNWNLYLPKNSFWLLLRQLYIFQNSLHIFGINTVKIRKWLNMFILGLHLGSDFFSLAENAGALLQTLQAGKIWPWVANAVKIQPKQQ